MTLIIIILNIVVCILHNSTNMSSSSSSSSVPISIPRVKEDCCYEGSECFKDGICTKLPVVAALSLVNQIILDQSTVVTFHLEPKELDNCSNNNCCSNKSIDTCNKVSKE